MIDKVKVLYLSTEENQKIYLTQNQMIYFGISNKDSLTLKFASMEFNLGVSMLSEFSQDSNKLYLSEDLENKLHIPNGTVLQIRKVCINQLELGPLIGIFVNKESLCDLTSGKFNLDYTLFAMTSQEMYGMCCFFSLDNVDFKNNVLTGLIRRNHNWICTTLPIPKIIYDQNHKLHCRANGIELRNRLGKDYVVLNTMTKLSKWETICALSKNPSLVDHIPKTIKYSSENLKKSLEKSSTLYLKPNSLSKGKGIFCITKKDSETFIVKYRTKEQNHVVTLKNLQNLDTLLSNYIDTGQGYIIQKEIKKALFRNSPFDIRLLFQKDYSGFWQPSGLVARLGAYESIITSPRSGGSVMDLKIVLNEVFNEDISDENGLYNNILSLGKEICNSIDIEFGNCVELGLDIAIDIYRNIWIIEVNGKPLKVSLKRLGNSKLILDFNRRPIEYAVFLTGFQSFNTG